MVIQKRNLKSFLTVMVVLAIAGAINHVGAAELVWQDDFESYSPSSFPSPPWHRSGNNPGAYIDNTVSFSGSQSMHLHGVIGGCWGVLVFREITTPPPFTVELMVRNGSENIYGCHPYRGSLELKSGTFWGDCGRGLMLFQPDGQMRLHDSIGWHYDELEWVKVRVDYSRPNDTTVHLAYYVDGELLYEADDGNCPCEDDLAYIVPGAQEGTVWIDDVKVYAQQHHTKIAIVNPDSFRIVKFGHLVGGCPSPLYYSIAYGTNGDCSFPDHSCWTGVGEQQDFIGTVLTSAGYSVDYFAANSLPPITPADYQLLIVQDPLKSNQREFPMEVEDNLPNLLEHVVSAQFAERLETYFHSGGTVLLVGDAVRLLEDFGKTINADIASNTLSNPDPCVPQKWLFERGHPFCCRDRLGSGSYYVESGSLMPAGTKLSDINLFDGHDLPKGLTWSDVVYYPSDGISLLDVRVQGTGEYVLSGAICNPPVYTVTVDDVLSNFMGYTLHEGEPIFYLGSDTYFDYRFVNYDGAWHCGEYMEMEYTTTNEGKQILLNLIDHMLAVNQPPTAYIDQITPNPAALGEEVTFVGRGEDPDGSITDYEWYSAIDGILSDEATFSTTDLSDGFQVIRFRVRDDMDEWSDPEWEEFRVVDGMVFRPPDYFGCQTATGKAGISDTAASCNSMIGELSVYTRALVGHACAAAGQNIEFDVDELGIVRPGIVQIDAELVSFGARVVSAPGNAMSQWGFHHYQWNGSDYDFRQGRFGYIDDPWDEEWFKGELLMILSALIPGYAGNIIEGIALLSTVEDYQEFLEAIETNEYSETHYLTGWIKVEPGSHYLSVALQSKAVQLPVGVPQWNAVARIGLMKYVTIQNVESGPEDELIVYAQCPIDLIVADPEGRTISILDSDIPSATYVEADLDLDGDLDDQIYIPGALDGVYTITVEPDSGADPGETFSLLISYEGESFVLARDVEISDIPDEPYRIRPFIAEFHVTTSDITILPEWPCPGDSVDICSAIWLDASSRDEVDSVRVRFYDGDPDGPGIQIDGDQMVLDLEPGDSDTIRMKWTFPDSVPHAIYTVIDPENVFLEHNKENNKAVKIHAPTVPACVDMTNGSDWPGVSHPVFCYVELPGGYDPKDIRTETILLGGINGSIRPTHFPDYPWEIGDYDEDGVFDLMITFDNAEIVQIIEPDSLVLTLTGKVDYRGSERCPPVKDVPFEAILTPDIERGNTMAHPVNIKAIPKVAFLGGNHPNPFRFGTSISCGIAKSSTVTLTIFDATGRAVATLLEDNLEPGYYTVYWNGKDQSGQETGAGIYFYRLTSGEFTATKKMILLR